MVEIKNFPSSSSDEPMHESVSITLPDSESEEEGESVARLVVAMFPLLCVLCSTCVAAFKSTSKVVSSDFVSDRTSTVVVLPLKLNI